MREPEPYERYGVADWLEHDAPACHPATGESLDPRLAAVIRRNAGHSRAAIVAAAAFRADAEDGSR